MEAQVVGGEAIERSAVEVPLVAQGSGARGYHREYGVGACHYALVFGLGEIEGASWLTESVATELVTEP